MAISDLSPGCSSTSHLSETPLPSFIRKKEVFSQDGDCGVPTVVLWVKNLTAVAQVAMESRVRPSPGTVGYRIWCCHSCSSDSIPSLGTSICHKCGCFKKKKKKKKKDGDCGGSLPSGDSQGLTFLREVSLPALIQSSISTPVSPLEAASLPLHPAPTLGQPKFPHPSK